MIGSFDVVVKNARIQYKFTVNRNITILKGDSATGKTTLIDMIDNYQRFGDSSGVEIRCDKPCVVLQPYQWEMNLAHIVGSIVFIDEGDPFVKTRDFARAIQATNNYYVIATRVLLPTLPYSIKEVYGIKNKSGNRYQHTKRLYSEFYPIHDTSLQEIERPDLVIVEDSHAGYEFFEGVCRHFGIECISAGEKSNVFQTVTAHADKSILLIADGAAFGSEIDAILKLKQNQDITIYLPESFEWLILKSGLVANVQKVLAAPQNHIESQEYFSWERFFTALLMQETQGSYLQYTKNHLNPVYLQPHERQAILRTMPPMEWIDSDGGSD